MPEKRAGMAKWDKFVRAMLAKKADDRSHCETFRSLPALLPRILEPRYFSGHTS